MTNEEVVAEFLKGTEHLDGGEEEDERIIAGYKKFESEAMDAHLKKYGRPLQSSDALHAQLSVSNAVPFITRPTAKKCIELAIEETLFRECGAVAARAAACCKGASSSHTGPHTIPFAS
jgi:hypothetical protein